MCRSKNQETTIKNPKKCRFLYSFVVSFVAFVVSFVVSIVVSFVAFGVQASPKPWVIGFKDLGI